MSGHVAKLYLEDSDLFFVIVCNEPDDAKCNPRPRRSGILSLPGDSESKTCDVQDWYQELNFESLEVNKEYEIKVPFPRKTSPDHTLSYQLLGEFDFKYRFEQNGEEFYATLAPRKETAPDGD